jgi:hypothetical protein
MFSVMHRVLCLRNAAAFFKLDSMVETIYGIHDAIDSWAARAGIKCVKVGL